MAVTSPKFDANTLTYGASLTKLLAATCFMQLVEQDKVSLDDDFRRLVPELRDMQILRGFTEDEKPILEDNERPMSLGYVHPHTLLYIYIYMYVYSISFSC